MADIFSLFASIAKKKPENSGPVKWIVAGLGNPGKDYEGTRHNAGFMALDTLAAKCGVDVKSVKFKALVGDGYVGNEHILLLKPQTFMNASGEALQAAADFYRIEPSHIIVLCDDISFEPGHLRIRRKGSAGGHNGLKSIIEHIGSEDFIRMKIGVGQKPCPEYDLCDWVLGRFAQSDTESVTQACKKAADAVYEILRGELEHAMNLYST